MSTPLPNTYDQLPYMSRPRRNNHPDTFATVARLMGMNPEPVDRARVLEIGCSTGGNLTALAATLPQSEFVGIDLSSVQIEMAKKVAADIGVRNVDYRAMSLTDFGPSEGRFDYIICHGVFSWVPTFVQDKILEVCQQNLAPNGVAYVSYNTYPGWHLRMPAREMMLYFLRRVSKPEHRAEAARGFFNFVAKSNPRPESVYGQLLKLEADILKDQPDYYLAHEHLDAENKPCYFTEFMERASKQNLQYLGNAEPEFRLSDLPEEAQGAVQQISGDLIQLEQYIDMIMGRTFRRTLLCHADTPLNRAPETETIFTMLASAGARPQGDEPNIKSSAIEVFKDQRGQEISTNNPISKAVFWLLWKAWPKAVRVEDMMQLMEAELGVNWARSDKAARDTIARTLLEGYMANSVTLQTHLPEFTKEVSAKPKGYTLARYWCQNMESAPTYRHQEVILTNLQRYVLGHTDGTRTRDELVQVVQEALDRKLFPGPDGPVDEAVDAALKHLAESAVLES